MIEDPARRSTVVLRGQEHLVLSTQTPQVARSRLRSEVIAALRAYDIHCFAVRSTAYEAAVVGVLAADRERAIAALSQLDPTALYLDERYPDTGKQPLLPCNPGVLRAVPDRCSAIRLTRRYASAGGTLLYGENYGTTIEFWADSADVPDAVIAPRPNVASQIVDRSELAPTEIEVDGARLPSIRLFDRRFPDDVGFPIDAVYTWVDGNDPAWRERFARARADAAGVEFHAEAHGSHRYESRDELRYSLRSLNMYAPWIQHVYLVTDQQVPTWLDPSSSRITVVDHRDIFDDPDVLPVFNSSAITTQLHHIPGLSEHYLYLNDDMFFGADVRPTDFWYGSGVAKVFPARNRRPFTPARPDDPPHLNISANIRRLLESAVDVSISTAIRHTPYPQVRSVNEDLERRFADELARTAGHRFRHHDDIAQDQLFHYWAQITGQAVASRISYDYVNVGSLEDLSRLRRLLATRGRRVFCLNDAPQEGLPPIPPIEVQRFLEAYYPIAAPWEFQSQQGAHTPPTADKTS